ncbi:SGNH/GDSL hydrolase family protein [Verrucomicrobiota bacterium]
MLIVLVAAAVVVQLFVSATPPRSDSRSMEGMILLGWPDFWRFVPRTKTIAVSPTAEFTVAYRINTLGMRDRERDRAKTHNRHRIVFIGDSFTEGYGVPQDKAYPRSIEDLSDGRLECFNLGLRGMSPSFAYFRLQRLLDEGYQFDTVVLQVFDNDFDDDVKHTDRFHLSINPETQSIERDPFSRSSQRTKVFGPLAWPLSHVKLMWLLASRFTNRPPKGEHASRFPLELAKSIRAVYENNYIAGVTVEDGGNGTAKISFPVISDKPLSVAAVDQLWCLLRDYNLSDRHDGHKRGVESVSDVITNPGHVKQSLDYLGCIVAMAKQNHIPLLVVYQPSLPLISRKNEDIFAEWCTQNNVPFMSLREHLRAVALNSEQAVFFPIDGHLTAYGHQVVAEKLLGWINEHR